MENDGLENNCSCIYCKSGMSVTTSHASGKTDDRIPRCLLNLGRVLTLSYSQRCNSQFLHSCQNKHRNLGYYLYGTYICAYIYISAYFFIVKTDSVTEKMGGLTLSPAR